MPKPEFGDGLNFYLAQARLRALYSDKPDATVAWFRDALEDTLSPAQASALQYGLAIALQRERQFDEARELLGSLLLSEPEKLPYLLQLADLNTETGQREQALETLENLHLTFPGNHAIVMEYASALLYDRNAQDAEKARRILQSQVVKRNDDPRLYELLARASSIAGKQAQSDAA